MPGFLVHAGALVTCSHAGPATPTVPSPTVSVSGQPIVTASCPYVVTGCTQAAVPLPPCVTATWISGATRLLSNGMSVILLDSLSSCVPTATPLLIITTQIRASGT